MLRLSPAFLFSLAAAAGLLACEANDSTAPEVPAPANESAEATTLESPGDSAVPVSATASLVSTIPLPINQSKSTTGNLFALTQTGTGPAGLFKISNTSNTKDALLGQSNGSGSAVHGIALGTGGAATFEGKSSLIPVVTVIANGAEGVRTQQRGAGPAGFFENVNSTSTANTMELYNLGKGKGLSVTSLNNNAGSFVVQPGTIGYTALVAESKGTGSAIQGTAISGQGVRGIASTGNGGFFQNQSPSSTNPALLVRTNGTDFAARFEGLGFNAKGVLIETHGGAGLQVVGGSKNGVVRTPSGAKALYTEESTEVWFTDYGFGRLAHGKGRILFDPSFAQTINPNENYHVFVQPYGSAELYVAERTPLGFTVALKDGDPNVEFSYRIVAKRLGFERKRLESAPWADELPGEN